MIQAFCGLLSGTLVVLSLVALPAQATLLELENRGYTLQLETSVAQRLELDWPAIDRVRYARGGGDIWHDGNRLNDRGRQLYARLASAGADGLDPDDYHLKLLQTLQDRHGPDDRLLRELLLTDGYLRLARDLRLGSPTTRALDPYRSARKDAQDPVAGLVDALDRDSLPALLDDLAPASDAYRRLRLALARYLAIEQAGGWPVVDSDHSLRPGEREPQIERLRLRLAVEAGRPLTQSVDPQRFDGELEEALKQAQRRYGLEPDGIAGRATLEALNVPIERRIAQLRANLERWRWLPHRLADDHLLVNAAGFELTLVVQGQAVFHTRAVTGTGDRPTPSLISRVTHLLANPDWTVPRRIAVEDMLPQQQQDPGYLARKQIRAYRRRDEGWEAFDPAGIDWSPYNADNFPFVLRQDPGAGNSLGRVKFHMPNADAVYLHDTPATGLFRRTDRALSSGCVRVEGAQRLAQLLIARAEPWEAERFTRAMRSGETLLSPLSRPIPVYLTYFTSWVDASGEVQFRPDIYRRDTDLILALGGERPPVTALQRSEAVSQSL